MIGAAALAIAAIALRMVSSPTRWREESPWPMRAVSWMCCATAAWLATAASGVMSPFWTAPALGLIAAIAETRTAGRMIKVAADVGVVAIAAGLSIPPLSPVTALLLAVVIAIGGAGVDTLGRKIAPRFATIMLAAPMLALLLFFVLRNEQSLTILRNLNRRLPQIAMTVDLPLTRVTLETGSNAFVENAAASRPGALFFHGANPDGALQPTAAVIRRTLITAGFCVVSVEHPGYGRSPAPGVAASIEAWDPLPTARAGLEELKRIGVDSVTLVGHSLGCVDALRLASVAEVDAVVLMGAGLADPDGREDYWYARFHKDRGMSDRLPRERYEAIFNRFYRRRTAAADLPTTHAPVYFVVFEHEHSDIEASRTTLYDLISEPKRWIMLRNSNHYLNTSNLGPILIADTRTARILAHEFEGLQPESPKPR